ncbi:MAG TPA: hypothetical protein VJN18_18495, partial [Polyangiaceae bacterium]|nr:hypothetical protein [Polyangiaceae bacterium]
CISLMPLPDYLQFFAELAAPGGPLIPEPQVQCRYRLRESALFVDIMDVEGKTIGATNPWFKRAAERASTYKLDDGRNVRAVSPPFFLATKLVALRDLERCPEIDSAKDAEDIVTLAVEMPDLVAQVSAEDIAADVAAEWQAVFDAHRIDSSDLPELVDAHLGRDDRSFRARVVSCLRALADG